MFAQNQAMGGIKYQCGGNDKTSCECQYHKKLSGARCKHITAVEISILSETSELVNEDQQCNSTILERPDIKCPHCKSKKFTKNGKRKHKHKESSQTYKCSNCKYRFTHNYRFEQKRHNCKIIILSIALFSVGFSPNSTSAMFKNCSWHVHPDTISRWAATYSAMVTPCRNTASSTSGQEDE